MTHVNAGYTAAISSPFSTEAFDACGKNQDPAALAVTPNYIINSLHSGGNGSYSARPLLVLTPCKLPIAVTIFMSAGRRV